MTILGPWVWGASHLWGSEVYSWPINRTVSLFIEPATRGEPIDPSEFSTHIDISWSLKKFLTVDDFISWPNPSYNKYFEYRRQQVMRVFKVTERQATAILRPPRWFQQQLAYSFPTIKSAGEVKWLNLYLRYSVALR
jgi:hypothetical protein